MTDRRHEPTDAGGRGTDTQDARDTRDTRDSRDTREEEPPIDEVAEEVEERNPDPTTKREAFEREAAERGRTDEAREVGEEIDGESGGPG